MLGNIQSQITAATGACGFHNQAAELSPWLPQLPARQHDSTTACSLKALLTGTYTTHALNITSMLFLTCSAMHTTIETQCRLCGLAVMPSPVVCEKKVV
jgi:hypothetical protein